MSSLTFPEVLTHLHVHVHYGVMHASSSLLSAFFIGWHPMGDLSSQHRSKGIDLLAKHQTVYLCSSEVCCHHRC